MISIVPMSRATAVLMLLGASAESLAHVEYYDLNQGKQITDLTPAQGRAASTAQYGLNPLVSGSSINRLSDRPLNDPALWTATYQSTSTVGQFADIVYTSGLSTATVRVNDVSDRGWGDGTRAVLGDSHKVDFFNFRLSEKSRVSISWNVFDGDGNFFDAGFSLYRGVLSYQAHDDALDPLNPKSGFPPRRLQNPLDTGSVFDAQAIAADFRNTRTNAVDYAGQFNALGNWGQANSAGNWSNIAWLAAVDAHNPVTGFAASAASTLETLVIDLEAGNFTIAASGALGAVGFGTVAAPFGISGLNGELKFRASALTAIPLPGALSLLIGAISGCAALARIRRARRCSIFGARRWHATQVVCPQYRHSSRRPEFQTWRYLPMTRNKPYFGLAVALGALALASHPAHAHQTYNLTGVNIGMAHSVDNSDGVSNTDGYRPVGIEGRVAGAGNANIPGTGGLPTDYTGALPYNLYLGHHDSTATGQTTRNGVTGLSATTPNSLWRAYAVQDASPTWGALVPDIASSHPYLAVGANSWQVGSSAGGLDYTLIHASAGTNNDAKNVTTAGAALGQIYQIDITIKRDGAYDDKNDMNALLDVALYRGADSSSSASRTAAFDPHASTVQGSTLGSGGANGSALLWSAHQTMSSEVLRYTLLIDFDEWQRTDALEGSLNDGLAGFYTLIIGAHGGAPGAALAYTVDSHSFTAAAPVPVPAAGWLFAAALGTVGALRRRSGVA